MVQDIAKSVRNRLLEQTRKTHGNYQQVLIRFFHERLMYRLAKSTYRSSFYLKGGSLLFALNPIIARPTLDVDLLGMNDIINFSSTNESNDNNINNENK